MILKGKNAVIYGAGGDIGGAVARAFAREGARLFLSGRTLGAVSALASEIVARGGVAEAAQVDALDERAIEGYVARVVEKVGALDISFCAISVAKALPNKVPLVELSAEQFALPIAAYTQSNFLTARSAARAMVAKRSGVILTITATPGRIGFANVGGNGPAFAAIEGLSRSLSVELAPHGVRVLCLMPNAIPETATIRENFARYAQAAGATAAEFQARLAATTHLRRLTTLDELANTAAFMASDQASGMTGTVVNLSGGAVPG
ncbi:MAG TPA: SDR family oxidoreductase [Polyangiaceae bacterium]|nr:SDR family oxidoreductase [Polyangiaceae bacterium]